MTSRRQAMTALLLPAFAALVPVFAAAQTPSGTPPASVSANALKYTNNLQLGYVRTTSAQLNADTQKGMEELCAEVKKRTAVKLQGVVGLDLERDDISFFHFMYWPVTPDAKPLSELAQKRVQHYIDTGGVILFDLRDAGGAMRDKRALRRVLADLNIAPLMQLPKDHILTKTFYILSNLPGSSAHGITEVEVPAAKGIERVSSLIAGDNNWGDAWAGKTVLPGTREREMALRAGIHLVLGAYGGNFKTDPILPVLERLGR